MHSSSIKFRSKFHLPFTLVCIIASGLCLEIKNGTPQKCWEHPCPFYFGRQITVDERHVELFCLLRLHTIGSSSTLLREPPIEPVSTLQTEWHDFVLWVCAQRINPEWGSKLLDDSQGLANNNVGNFISFVSTKGYTTPFRSPELNLSHRNFEPSLFLSLSSTYWV